MNRPYILISESINFLKDKLNNNEIENDIYLHLENVINELIRLRTLNYYNKKDLKNLTKQLEEKKKRECHTCDDAISHIQ